MFTLFHDLVERAAEHHAAAPAITAKTGSVSYGELAELTGRVAGGLLASGLRRDERVVVYLDKRVETVVAMLATSAAGGVFVPANPLLKPGQLVHVVDDCAARVLVTTADRLRVLQAELARCKSVELVVVVGGGADAYPDDGFAVVDWAELASCPAAAPGHARTDADVAAIFYTSGSTGRPKGVVLSHRNIVVGATSVASYLGNHAADRILSVLPLSFDAGFSQLTTAFSVGAEAVLVNYLLPGEVVRLCARHRITGLTCVPPLWIQLAEQEWPAEAAAHLRYFASTGGRMPRTVLDRLRTLFPAARPYLMYGLTEAFRSTYLDPEQVDVRPDSIGKAIPNAEILVVRPDGTLCEAGEEGELVHRGPLVSLGYWNDPQRTAERFRPSPGRAGELTVPELAVWSGDVVVRDEEDYLYFRGRRDEMIKTSGYRVSPTEIEELVHQTGLVSEVVALGVDDARLGQRIEIVVVARPGVVPEPEEIIARLRPAMPLYMLPKAVHVRAELPRSPNGKIDRVTLREALS